MTPNGVSRTGILDRLIAIVDSALGGRAGSGKVIGRDDATEPQRNDIEFQKYISDRAHELELNKFSHAFELERLKILLFLNGGAFSLAATFSKALTQGDGLSRWLAIAAIVSWISGLIVAARAIQLALDLQVAFAQAYHNRRRSIEWRLLADKYPSKEERERVLTPPTRPQAGKWRLSKRIVTRWPKMRVGLFVWRSLEIPEQVRARKAQAAGQLTVEGAERRFNELAEERRMSGDQLKPKVKRWATMSVGLFVAGAVFMMVAIGSTAQEPTSEVTLNLQLRQTN